MNVTSNGGTIPLGGPRGWPTRFQNDGFLTFTPAATVSDAEWWSSNVLAVDGRLLPDKLAKAFIHDLIGGGPTCVIGLSSATASVTVEFSGSVPGESDPWLSAYELDFGKKVLWKSLTDIPSGLQGRGMGKTFTRNIYMIAKILGFRSLMLHAIDAGSYAWLRHGFLPFSDQWDGMKVAIRQRIFDLERARLISQEMAGLALTLAAGPTPRSAAAIAALETPVRSHFRDASGRPAMVPLGRALIAEANDGKGASWRGSLDLNDDGAVSVLLGYTARTRRSEA